MRGKLKSLCPGIGTRRCGRSDSSSMKSRELTWYLLFYGNQTASRLKSARSVKCIHATPFHGMTDILLIGEKSLGLIRVQSKIVVCSGEVGVDKEATSLVTIAGEVKVWPEKMGELLASMYSRICLERSTI